MAEPLSTPDDEQALRMAADWWTRLRDPALPGQAVEQWLAWMAADERHPRAFEQVNALGARLAALGAEARAQAVAEFAPPRPARRRWTRYAAAAAAALVLAVLGWRLAVPGAETRSYASAVGQDQQVALPDGSSAALGGATAMVARYDRGRRQVELRDGEAFFQVRHEPRPFEVAAGPLRIRDLGTAFDVRRTGQWVTVAVSEGRVRIEPAGHGGRPIEAVAGQQVSYDPRTAALSVARIDVGQAAAWRRKRLEFVGEPLAVVVANVNRYSARPVRIADAQLGGLTFTGTVHTDAVDSWLGALPQVFPLQVARYPDRVELSAATSR